MLWEKESIKLKFVSTATPGTVALSQPLNPCCKKRPDTCHRFKRSYISQSLDRSRYIAIISDLFRRGILKKPKISVESELPKLPLLECMQADCTRSEAIFWKVFTAGRQGSFVTIQTQLAVSNLWKEKTAKAGKVGRGQPGSPTHSMK